MNKCIRSPITNCTVLTYIYIYIYLGFNNQSQKRTAFGTRTKRTAFGLLKSNKIDPVMWAHVRGIQEVQLFIKSQPLMQQVNTHKRAHMQFNAHNKIYGKLYNFPL